MAGEVSIRRAVEADVAVLHEMLNLPAAIVQEGGYLCPELGDNLRSFLSGFIGENGQNQW